MACVNKVMRFYHGKKVILSMCKYWHGHSSVRIQKQLSTSSVTHQFDISGIFPPIPTPFNEDETINFDKLEFNMKIWNKMPFKGYVVQGSNGEFCFLNWDEREMMVKDTKSLAAPGKLIIAGSGCESTRDTILLSKKMAEAGADAVLVVNPFYFKASMTADALTRHFTKVADQVPVPVILYNLPSNTGMDIPPEVVIKLAQHPNIIGMKDSGGDITRIASIVYETSSFDFQILAGSAGFLLAAHNVGCVGGICGIANVLGNEVCELLKLAQAGDLKSAMDLQLRLVIPNSYVTRRLGVPGLKKAMEWFGYYGGPTRSPLTPLKLEEEQALKKAFKKSLFL
ncbi:4-hydroxy-2-oxoglutarate aldolase, mitochondrial-like [Physella acuta]|uniref:4-hydroxy-2-oxoglutarate aldolase, mitochondrial-like n=1 Tax=Physella acuta TaxID=109671 RepID=UPI0027DBCDB6|nr:4-hydroxy-2-oxoglutarate aldolase, mitochondrial-like [Physella acuta]XP_059157060.1 4-hydroxy-2-oxoglutarate aldolase, mitochondrial-like [Physella acuta]XP_059157061.1 4-hydroxy-2-oxoglutarate aldolase, mitochondrial-like [Physella acuta]XP_059157062.1 4-hydroxy-2-oxoglutarate aldolase, mitochondrial-like [Physella acuta]XP_059157063.1 4-hydroxy-2-oxoglutarate aldolase, mitochondrial-like [Physella acuta]XP_059157065.1 4-hydroxy-2-oxoglutarate aldolase, mitochondrial-like [Physella acuta]